MNLNKCHIHVDMFLGKSVINKYVGFHYFAPIKTVVLELVITVGIFEVNISNKSDSVSSGCPNTEKRDENTTCSRVFLTKFEVFG